MLKQKQKFNSRVEIGDLLGGDVVKGIVTTNKINAILLFTNEEELYSDYFYPRGSYNYCLYTGIGRFGNQDSIENNMYDLNISVLNHKKDKKPLLVFEKKNSKYYFIWEYELTETHQNTQPDDDDNLRRVFVFNLKKIKDNFSY